MKYCILYLYNLIYIFFLIQTNIGKLFKQQQYTNFQVNKNKINIFFVLVDLNNSFRLQVNNNKNDNEHNSNLENLPLVYHHLGPSL